MLEVQGIRKTFGGLVAVNDAYLRVVPERITALIGPNGAGKTTLFAIIAGFLKPDTGSVRYDGREIAGLPPYQICRLGIARTFQIVQPFGKLSVRENIAVGAHLRAATTRKALDRAEAIAATVGMEAMLDQPAEELTIAGRKRLELARALATQPRLLLLDEVMAGLTPTEVDAIVSVIRKIHREGTAILLIEHLMRAVMSLADDITVLSNGSVIAQGDPASVTSDPAVIEAYLGHGAAEAMKVMQ